MILNDDNIFAVNKPLTFSYLGHRDTALCLRDKTVLEYLFAVARKYPRAEGTLVYRKTLVKQIRNSVGVDYFCIRTYSRSLNRLEECGYIRRHIKRHGAKNDKTLIKFAEKLTSVARRGMSKSSPPTCRTRCTNVSRETTMFHTAVQGTQNPSATADTDLTYSQPLSHSSNNKTRNVPRTSTLNKPPTPPAYRRAPRRGLSSFINRFAHAVCQIAHVNRYHPAICRAVVEIHNPKQRRTGVDWEDLARSAPSMTARQLYGRIARDVIPRLGLKAIPSGTVRTTPPENYVLASIISTFRKHTHAGRYSPRVCRLALEIQDPRSRQSGHNWSKTASLWPSMSVAQRLSLVEQWCSTGTVHNKAPVKPRQSIPAAPVGKPATQAEVSALLAGAFFRRGPGPIPAPKPTSQHSAPESLPDTELAKINAELMRRRKKLGL